MLTGRTPQQGRQENNSPASSAHMRNVFRLKAWTDEIDHAVLNEGEKGHQDEQQSPPTDLRLTEWDYHAIEGRGRRRRAAQRQYTVREDLSSDDVPDELLERAYRLVEFYAEGFTRLCGQLASRANNPGRAVSRMWSAFVQQAERYLDEKNAAGQDLGQLLKSSESDRAALVGRLRENEEEKNRAGALNDVQREALEDAKEELQEERLLREETERARREAEEAKLAAIEEQEKEKRARESAEAEVEKLATIPVKLSKEGQKLKRLENEAGTLKDELESARSSEAEMKDRLEATLFALNQKRSEALRLGSELTNVKTQLSSTQEAYQAESTRADSLKQELEQVEQRFSQAQSRLQAAKSTESRALDDVERLGHQLKTAREQAASDRRWAAKAETERERALEQLAAETESVKRLQAEKRFDATSGDAKESQSTRLDELTKDNFSAHARIGELGEESAQLKERAEQAEAECVHLRYRLAFARVGLDRNGGQASEVNERRKGDREGRKDVRGEVSAIMERLLREVEHREKERHLSSRLEQERQGHGGQSVQSGQVEEDHQRAEIHQGEHGDDAEKEWAKKLVKERRMKAELASVVTYDDEEEDEDEEEGEVEGEGDEAHCHPSEWQRKSEQDLPRESTLIDESKFHLDRDRSYGILVTALNRRAESLRERFLNTAKAMVSNVVKQKEVPETMETKAMSEETLRLAKELNEQIVLVKQEIEGDLGGDEAKAESEMAQATWTRERISEDLSAAINTAENRSRQRYIADIAAAWASRRFYQALQEKHNLSAHLSRIQRSLDEVKTVRKRSFSGLQLDQSDEAHDAFIFSQCSEALDSLRRSIGSLCEKAEHVVDASVKYDLTKADMELQQEKNRVGIAWKERADLLMQHFVRVKAKLQLALSDLVEREVTPVEAKLISTAQGSSSSEGDTSHGSGSVAPERNRKDWLVEMEQEMLSFERIACSGLPAEPPEELLQRNDPWHEGELKEIDSRLRDFGGEVLKEVVALRSAIEQTFSKAREGVQSWNKALEESREVVQKAEGSLPSASCVPLVGDLCTHAKGWTSFLPRMAKGESDAIKAVGKEKNNAAVLAMKRNGDMLFCSKERQALLQSYITDCEGQDGRDGIGIDPGLAKTLLFAEHEWCTSTVETIRQKLLSWHDAAKAAERATIKFANEQAAVTQKLSSAIASASEYLSECSCEQGMDDAWNALEAYEAAVSKSLEEASESEQERIQAALNELWDAWERNNKARRTVKAAVQEGLGQAERKLREAAREHETTQSEVHAMEWQTAMLPQWQEVEDEADRFNAEGESTGDPSYLQVQQTTTASGEHIKASNALEILKGKRRELKARQMAQFAWQDKLQNLVDIIAAVDMGESRVFAVRSAAAQRSAYSKERVDHLARRNEEIVQRFEYLKSQLEAEEAEAYDEAKESMRVAVRNRAELQRAEEERERMRSSLAHARVSEQEQFNEWTKATSKRRRLELVAEARLSFIRELRQVIHLHMEMDQLEREKQVQADREVKGLPSQRGQVSGELAAARRRHEHRTASLAHARDALPKALQQADQIQQTAESECANRLHAASLERQVADEADAAKLENRLLAEAYEAWHSGVERDRRLGPALCGLPPDCAGDENFIPPESCANVRSFAVEAAKKFRRSSGASKGVELALLQAAMTALETAEKSQEALAGHAEIQAEAARRIERAIEVEVRDELQRVSEAYHWDFVALAKESHSLGMNVAREEESASLSRRIASLPWLPEKVASEAWEKARKDAQNARDMERHLQSHQKAIPTDQGAPEEGPRPRASAEYKPGKSWFSATEIMERVEEEVKAAESVYEQATGERALNVTLEEQARLGIGLGHSLTPANVCVDSFAEELGQHAVNELAPDESEEKGGPPDWAFPKRGSKALTGPEPKESKGATERLVNWEQHNPSTVRWLSARDQVAQQSRRREMRQSTAAFPAEEIMEQSRLATGSNLRTPRHISRLQEQAPEADESSPRGEDNPSGQEEK